MVAHNAKREGRRLKLKMRDLIQMSCLDCTVSTYGTGKRYLEMKFAN